MNRQASHAYFQHNPNPNPNPNAKHPPLPLSRPHPHPASLLHHSRSHPNLRPVLKQSTLNQSRHSNSSFHQKSQTRSGIYLTSDNKRSKRDKQIQKLYEELNSSRMKIRELQQKQIQNFVLKKQNQMFRLQLQKIKEQIKIYCLQEKSPNPNPNSPFSPSPSHLLEPSQLSQVNSKYQSLSQHNAQNLRIIADLKLELNNYVHENKRLKSEIVSQQQIAQKVKYVEGLCRKLEVDIQAEGRQWEVQKATFIEILHAEIEEGKKKGW